MTIAPELLKEYPKLDDSKKNVIGTTEGAVLVVAGPGSGKTFSLALRTLNLLLLEKAEPNEIILCTFTQKAAFELRDRVSAVAAKIGYTSDLSGLRTGTIHSICSTLLSEHRHRTPLGNNYETLDELTELLFIFEQFEQIIGPGEKGLFLGKWKTKWTAIEGVRRYFDKITEELVDPSELTGSRDSLLQQLGKAYIAYRTSLFDNNRLDFAHLQRLVYDLLLDPKVSPKVTTKIKYVLVDEYQDTNTIQEQIVLQLSSATGNLCVVGDEDQSLYRFRGATVRNILEFPDRVKDCKIFKLTTNYRSHEKIVRAYDGWMASADWSNSKGRPFRYDKTIRPDPEAEYPNYPAVFSIWGADQRDESRRVADFVLFFENQTDHFRLQPGCASAAQRSPRTQRPVS